VTAAFAAATAVALIAILALVLTARRASARVAVQRSRVAQLDGQLAEARPALASAVEQADQASEALASAVEWAAEAGQRAAEAEIRLKAAGALWELERLRLEREWAEVTGTAAPLPEPWDGSIRAALAVELELIREVMGVPGRIEPTAEASAATQASAEDPLTSLIGFRLTAEVLRRLARVGDDIAVSLGADGVITIDVATHGGGPGPDLAGPTGAGAALGGELAVLPTDGGLQARLRLPGRGR